MAKFNMHDFVMKTLRKMVSGGETGYKVMQYALAWAEKDVLTEDDLAEIDALLDEREAAEEAADQAVLEAAQAAQDEAVEAEEPAEEATEEAAEEAGFAV